MNRISILSIIFVTVFFTAASAQVDTLQLVEIGSIQAPSQITELYVEDLDGDSLKEIIICTDYYVYIYNSQTYQVEWTSPPLNHPMDLLFKDINRDGFIDFSVKDSTNIYLFDPHTLQTIWTSPILESNYRCYTIGDRNGDAWTDVTYINYRPISDRLINDTASVILFDGPSFNSDSVHIILVYTSYYDEISWGFVYNNPDKINIISLSDNQSYNAKIIIDIDYNSGFGINHPSQYSYDFSGQLGFLDGDSLNYSSTYSARKVLQQMSLEYLQSSVLCTVGKRNTISGDYISFYETEIVYNAYTAESLLIGNTVYFCHDEQYYPPCSTWRGFSMGEYWSYNDYRELVYGIDSTIFVYSIPDHNYITQMEFIGFYEIIGRINVSDLVVNGLLIKIDPNRFYYAIININNHRVVGYVYDNIWFSRLDDLNNDLNDEIFRLYGNRLIIYNIDIFTGNNEQIQEVPAIFSNYFINTNYPNPFNSSTTIEYGLPEVGRVRVDIYDLLGRKVETLVDEEMQAGRHRAVWDASDFSSGVYFYRIEAGDFVDTKRMMYLK